MFDGLTAPPKGQGGTASRRAHTTGPITGQLGREYRGRDWCCPACYAEQGRWVRVCGPKERCFVCNAARDELERKYGYIPLVQDFLDGYFNEKGRRRCKRAGPGQ